MNKPLDQSDTCEVPVEISVTEQCEATLLHYERLADLAHEWNNQVPQAIRAWYAAINASPGSGGQPSGRSDSHESPAAGRCRGEAPHCQNGTSDICLAGKADGVVCAEDECDIDSGVRAAPSTAGGQEAALMARVAPDAADPVPPATTEEK